MGHSRFSWFETREAALLTMRNNSLRSPDSAHRRQRVYARLRRAMALHRVRDTKLQRHHDLAEMLVGFHVLERLADVVKGEHLVDRQLQFARFDRTPDIPAHLVEDLADLLDRAGAEGDADIVDAARGVQVEVEFGAGAAEPADIDDAALDFC